MKRRTKVGIEQLRPSGAIRRDARMARFRWQWLWICFTGIGLFLSLKLGRLYFPNVTSGQTHNNQATSSHLPQTFDELLTLPASELEKCDIARIDLLCAQGLPGAEELDLTNCLTTLNEWAGHVKSETERNFHRFQENPADFYYSEGYFRMLMMSVVMYEDYGIRYNPARIIMPGNMDPNDHFFADAHDVFIHGLIGNRKMGTCSSMPVLYIAIGRRLGYPLKLVTTKAHLFVRWESPTDRFDVEATGKGMNRYDDDHFKQWPFPVSDEEMRAEGYLKSLSPTEEVAVFLSLRGDCLKEIGNLSESANCFALASRLVPEKKSYRALLADTKTLSATQQREAVKVNLIAPAPQAVPNASQAAAPEINPLKSLNSQ